ncbi:hypothetical protein PFISCL1PPCAC_23682 [Pristionchus fissidentatus]|uniref:G protein-coupled receptor n=1 Tax=Pristionchus fissidentatus TaxID=1538716 RepID=A0AAV5WPD0_9BILA|nr:hypothetical protein PFISCL1PPCAC_23682 [Pristionchus fissidentatus]
MYCEILHVPEHRCYTFRLSLSRHSFASIEECAHGNNAQSAQRAHHVCSIVIKSINIFSVEIRTEWARIGLLTNARKTVLVHFSIDTLDILTEFSRISLEARETT